jgi:Putative addiction module component
MGVVHHQIAMTLENLEAEVLLLPKQSQVTLLARMLERLGQSNEIDQEVAVVWVEEAELRDRAMDNGQVAGIPAEQVFQRIRTSLQ